MRKALDRVYGAAGALAAIFLALIAATVLIQVGFNLVDRLAVLATGRAIGLVLPSYAEFTGYFLAASTFLAGAYTLRAGGHIRVRLVIDRLPRRARRAVELWCATAASVFMLYFTAWAVLLTHESWSFGDKSPGIVPVPLWIPQAAMTSGIAIFTLALLDEVVTRLRGGEAAGAAGDGEP